MQERDYKSYVYEPKWTKDIDRDPDHRPSDSGLVIEDRGEDVVMVLPVRGLGVLVIRGNAAKEWHGVSSFTKEQIQFEDAPL